MHSIQLSYNPQAKNIIFALELNASNKKFTSIWKANIAQIVVENIYKKRYCSIFLIWDNMLIVYDSLNFVSVCAIAAISSNS